MKLQTYFSGDKVCSKKHVLEKDMATKTVSLIGFWSLVVFVPLFNMYLSCL